MALKILPHCSSIFCIIPKKSMKISALVSEYSIPEIVWFKSIGLNLIAKFTWIFQVWWPRTFVWYSTFPTLIRLKYTFNNYFVCCLNSHIPYLSVKLYLLIYFHCLFHWMCLQVLWNCVLSSNCSVCNLMRIFIEFLQH